MGSPLPVHKRVGFLSLVPHCKSTIDGITDGRMLIIRSLWAVTNQPVPLLVITGPGGLAPLSAQEGRLPFTYAIL